MACWVLSILFPQKLNSESLNTIPRYDFLLLHLDTLEDSWGEVYHSQEFSGDVLRVDCFPGAPLRAKLSTSLSQRASYIIKNIERGYYVLLPGLASLKSTGQAGRLEFQKESMLQSSIQKQSRVWVPSSSANLWNLCYFLLSFQLIGWGWPILWRVVCFTQSLWI